MPPVPRCQHRVLWARPWWTLGYSLGYISSVDVEGRPNPWSSAKHCSHRARLASATRPAHWRECNSASRDKITSYESMKRRPVLVEYYSPDSSVGASHTTCTPFSEHPSDIQDVRWESRTWGWVYPSQKHRKTTKSGKTKSTGLQLSPRHSTAKQIRGHHTHEIWGHATRPNWRRMHLRKNSTHHIGKPQRRSKNCKPYPKDLKSTFRVKFVNTSVRVLTCTDVDYGEMLKTLSPM